jgi:IclR family pca regulon transcriptional regulator
MGRVLLAGLPDDALDQYLSRVSFSRLTGKTISTPEELRAELDKIRADGYSVVDQELEEGLRSLAAPIRDANGDVVAAVNISTQAARYSTEAVLAELVPAAISTADAISADLGRTQSSNNHSAATR